MHGDARGHLFESYRRDVLDRGRPAAVRAGEPVALGKGTLRGLHYQLARPQAEAGARPARGAISTSRWTSGGARPPSASWFAETLSAENKQQLFIPAGFAHGFCVLEDDTEVLYKCSDYYSGAADQKGVLWSDPDLGIPWPTSATPLVSDKDRTLLPLRAERSDLPEFGASVLLGLILRRKPAAHRGDRDLPQG